MAEAALFVGIDVSKAQLDVACFPQGAAFAVANDAAGRASWPPGWPASP